MADSEAPSLAENQGELDAQDMVHNGFNQDEADQWRGQGLKDMVDHGFSQEEAKKYYGFKEPDTSAMTAYVNKNIAAAKAAEPEKKREPLDVSVPQLPAEGLLDDVTAGWQQTVGSLFFSGRRPDIVEPENAPFFDKMVSHVTTLAGDAPLMMLGGAAGGGPASPVTAMGGAFAVPAGMRKLLMDQYDKGDIKDPRDFMTRMAAATWEASKQGAVGILAGSAGAIAGGVGAGVAGTASAETAAKLSAEAATMTAAGAAMEKRMPSWSDFGEAALLMGGFHAAGVAMGGEKPTGVPEKLGNIYRATGEKPGDVVRASAEDPVLNQEVLAMNPELPILPETEGIRAQPESKPEPVGDDTKSILPPDARKEILSRIASANVDDNRSYPQKMIETGTDLKDTLIKNWGKAVDWTRAIGNTLGEQGLKDLPAEENAHKLMNLLPASQQKMSLVMSQGTLDFNTLKVNGESYKAFKSDYAKAFPDDPQMQDFRAYGTAMRRQELVKRGFIRAGDDVSDNAVIAAGQKKIQPFLDRWVDFQNKGLKYLADSGVIKPEAYKSMVKDGQSYMDSHVLQVADELTGKTRGSMTALAMPKQIGDTFTLLGNEDGMKLLKDPIQAGLKTWETRIQMAERNRISQAFWESQLKLPEEERVWREVTDKSDNLSRMANAMVEKLNIKSADAYAVAAQMNREPYLQSGQHDFYIDGVRKIVEGDPDVMDAFKRMSGDRTSVNVAAKVLGSWSGILRALTVNNPLFAARHIGKNFEQSLTYSRAVEGENALTGGQKPGAYFLGVLKKLATDESSRIGLPEKDSVIPWFMKGDESYTDFVARGGAANWVLPLDKSNVDNELEYLNSKTPSLNKVWNTAKDIGSFTHMAITINDNLIRYKEYQRQIAAGASPLEAAYQARQVLPDWQKAAFQKSALQTAKAFLKIRMVGMDKMFTTLADPDTRLPFIAKNLMYVTSMELMFQAMNHGDDRMDDIPFRQKYTHWCTFVDHWRPANSAAEAQTMQTAYPSAVRKNEDGSYMVNDGTPWKFPKPFEPGVIFGSGLGALIDTMKTKNPAAMEDFMKEMVSQLVLDPIPDSVKPVAEQYMNKNIWTGNAIVKQGMLDRLPEEQSDKYTSETSKLLAKYVAKVPLLRDIGPTGTKLSSPPVIDNYLYDWGGTLGKYALQVSDKALRAGGIAPPDNRPAATLTEMPGIREFVIKNPSSHPQSIIDFQDRYQEATRVFNSLKDLKKKGDWAEYQRISSSYSEQLLDHMKGVNDTINTSMKMVNNIDVMPKNVVSDDKKRELEQQYYMLMVIAAKQGKQQMDVAAKAAKGGGQ